MRLLIDMNLSPRWVEYLAQNGIASSHWSAVGSPTASDLQIMIHAADTSSVVLTHDLDFGAILAATQGRKPSVVQVRSEGVSPEAIGSLVASPGAVVTDIAAPPPPSGRGRRR